jgi:hypothetical protein
MSKSDSIDVNNNADDCEVFGHSAHPHFLYEVHRWCVRRLRRLLDQLLIEDCARVRELEWVSHNNTLVANIRFKLEDSSFMCVKEEVIKPKLVFDAVFEALATINRNCFNGYGAEIQLHVNLAVSLEDSFWRELSDFKQTIPRDGHYGLAGEASQAFSEAWEDFENVAAQAWAGLGSWFSLAEESDSARRLNEAPVRKRLSAREGRSHRVQLKRRSSGGRAALLSPSPEPQQRQRFRYYTE